MSDDVAKFWVDGAQIVSALAAAVGLLIAAHSIRQQNNSIDASTVRTLLDDLKQSERDLAAARADPQKFEREFLNYANHLEVLATCVNSKLFGSVTRHIARNRLIEDLAIFGSTPEAMKLLEGSVDSPNTFSDIRKFLASNRRECDAAKGRRMAMKEPA